MGNLAPDQDPVTITFLTQYLIHTYWVKKLIALHDHLAAQMNHLLMDETHP